MGHSTVGKTTYNAQRQYRQTMNSTGVTYSDIKNAQKAYEDQKIALTMFQNMKRRFYAGRRRTGMKGEQHIHLFPRPAPPGVHFGGGLVPRSDPV